MADDLDKVTAVIHELSGAGKIAYAPNYLTATISGSDIILDAILRTYLKRPWYNNGSATTTSGEAAENVDIEIMNGAVVKRTISNVLLPYTYTSANIITDWGTMPASLKFRMYKMWQVVEFGTPDIRGHMAEVTRDL